MSKTRINQEKLEDWCNNLMPQCEHVFRHFFKSSKEDKDWSRNLEVYTKYISDLKASKADFTKDPNDYQKLMDAFYEIAEIKTVLDD